MIVLATILLTPAQGRTGDARLSTLSRGSQGAQLFADAAARLGWRVERDSAVPTRMPLRADRVYVILDPPEALTGREYARVFDAVRRGAGLLVVHPGGGAIEDSLGLERSSEGTRMRVRADAARACAPDEPRYGINWPGGDVYSWWLVAERPLPTDTVHFLPVMRPLTRAERTARGLDPDGASGVSPFADTGYVEPDTSRADAGADSAADVDAGADDVEDEAGDNDATIDSSDAPAADSATRREVEGLERALASATNAVDSAKLQRAYDEARARAARNLNDPRRRERTRREQQRREDSLRNARVPAPAAIGLPLGKGRVVVVADGDWLRNDVMRVCRWHAGVTAVRMLEWLSAGGTPRHLVVDEWHQGRGIHASAAGALGYFVVRDPRGRTLAQGVVAALLLLAALGARPLVPAGGGRIERRSPFEHVGALARAYEEIEATRIVTRRLVRGLRRRLGATASQGPGRDEESLLAALEARHPTLAPQVALVREALARPQTPARLLEVGRAVAEIERTVVRT